MTNSSQNVPGLTRIQLQYDEMLGFEDKLSLRIGNKVELHTTAGHVITGEVLEVIWDIHDELIYAVRIAETAWVKPLGDEKSKYMIYDRVVLMDHVFEIRPRLPEEA